MSDDVFAALHRDIEERERKGRETYGGAMRTFDGRDTLQDVYEEVLDAAAYLKKRLMEEAVMASIDTCRHCEYLRRLNAEKAEALTKTQAENAALLAALWAVRDAFWDDEDDLGNFVSSIDLADNMIRIVMAALADYDRVTEAQ